MDGDGAGEGVTGELEVLEVEAQAEGFRQGSGEAEVGELEGEKAGFLLVPAGDAGELRAGVVGGGVGEGP